MSQEEVLEVLRKNRKPIAGCEIAQELGYRKDKIFHTLKSLAKSRSIKVMEIDRFEAKKRYNSCRRMLLYYI
jgi:predicted Zn-ribbon and HTH transcriptional regulator